MKVAFFHPSFRGLGGAELLAAAQANYLKSADLDVSLVTFSFHDEIWRGKFEGIPVDIPARRHWSDLFSFGNKLRKWQGRGRRAEAFLQDADLILAHNPPTPAMLGHMETTARRFWYCHEAPWRLHPHSLDYFLIQNLPGLAGSVEPEPFGSLMHLREDVLADFAKNREWTQWDKEGVARMDGILANSDFCAQNLERIYGIQDIKVLPPAVSFGECEARSGLNRREFHVMTLARLELLKNVETVIRGFALFSSRASVRTRLHVVGDGHERARLETLARELGIADRVEFHGYLDALRDKVKLDAVFRACDVFALLSLGESFGLVFPEAAARGLLMVGPDHGGPVEILDGGRLGWTVPVLSSAGLGAALEEIWNLSDAEVDRKRAEALSACRERYSLEVVGPRLLALLAPT